MARTLLISSSGVRALRPASATRLRYSQSDVSDPAMLTDAVALAHRGNEDAKRDNSLFADARIFGPLTFVSGAASTPLRHAFGRPANWLVVRWQSTAGTNPASINEDGAKTDNNTIWLKTGHSGTAFVMVF